MPSTTMHCLVLTALIFGVHAGPASIYTYNLSYTTAMPLADGYEEQQFVTAITGLWNRYDAQLFVYQYAVDLQWLNISSQPGAWLSNTQRIDLSNLTDLIAKFNPLGVALYDPTVPSTSLLASTLAAVKGLLPVAYKPSQPSSLYNRVVAAGPRLPVVQSLVGQFNATTGCGSSKGNAYLWAIGQFLKADEDGAADGRYMGYYGDAYCSGPPYSSDSSAWDKITVTNQDWVIAQGGFLFDLGIWGDEAPVDDPGQPIGTDASVFRALLSAQYNVTLARGEPSFTHVTGFTPWWCKYTGGFSKHNHGGVDAEWATALLTSSWNTFVDADACCIGNMLSASFWQHHPLPERLVQAPPPTQQQLIDKGLLESDGSVPIKLFYYWYFGDYDSAAWTYSQVLQRWQDPGRGTVPIGWPIDPENALRFPPIFSYLYPQASASDVFIAGDSGAGYLNPTALYGPARALVSGLPNASDLWASWNTAWYRQMGLTFTGFVITGDAPAMQPADEAQYFSYSPNGIGLQQFTPHEHVTGSLPVVIETDIPQDVPSAVKTVLSQLPAAGATQPRFWMYRSVLTSPSFLAQVTQGASQASNGTAVAVDPLTLGYLMRVHAGVGNDNRVAYVADTLPAAAPASQPLSFTLSVRNDGWNVLSASNHSIQITTVSAVVYASDATAQRPTRLGAQAPGLDRLLASLGKGDLPAFPSNPARAEVLIKRYNARKVCVINQREQSSATVSVPLPSDLQVSGTVTVSASLPLQQLVDTVRDDCPQAQQGSITVITIQYQMVSNNADGGTTEFAANGNIPWQAAVVLQ